MVFIINHFPLNNTTTVKSRTKALTHPRHLIPKNREMEGMNRVEMRVRNARQATTRDKNTPQNRARCTVQTPKAPVGADSAGLVNRGLQVSGEEAK
jgi:hypothetical protein